MEEHKYPFSDRKTVTVIWTTSRKKANNKVLWMAKGSVLQFAP